MRVTFLIGTNIIQNKVGILEEVGIIFIILREDDKSDRVLCNIY